MRIFNSRLAIPEWTPLEDDASEDQRAMLLEKKEELGGYLSQIEQCFHDYRRTYCSVYEESPLEEERESHLTDLERQHGFEMVFMKERFIDPNGFLFTLGAPTEGAICCSMTLRLLREALGGFGDSLQVRENLIGFWLSSAGSAGAWTEAALMLEVCCWFDREAVSDYLRVSE
jgi:hypothetical protein